MAKQKEDNTSNVLSSIWALVTWLTGVLVSLAVGFGMIDGALSIRYIPVVVTEFAGWVVVILALLGLTLKVIDRLGN